MRYVMTARLNCFQTLCRHVIMLNHPVIMTCWHKWICDHNPAEYERVPKGSISHQLDPRYVGYRLHLNICEGIDETIHIHFFNDKESSAERKAQTFQEYNACRAWALQQQSMNSFKYVLLCQGKAAMPQFWDSYV
jgi:hypothetical protein